ncbi:MAG: adenylate/guanylate cyclase domain-containing protein [Eubacterium sp.]|nr:adenylate/guanylate cyclase domain-containing protein [Eubacterium sp.]
MKSENNYSDNHKTRIRLIIECLIFGILVFFLTVTNLLSSLDYIARDKLYQIPRGIDSDIKIIGIDEKTLEELGPMQTWSRSVYAELLEKLYENEENLWPTVVGFDIQFSGEIDQGDDEFSAIARKAGNVIIVNHLVYGKHFDKDQTGKYSLVETVESVEEPYDSLKDACLVGYSNIAQDSDGTVRRVILEESYGNNELKMFSNVVYEKYCQQMGISPSPIPKDKYGRSLINYSGRPGDYEYVSMIDVLNGDIDVRAFAGSLVLIGAYAPGMQDSFKVPNGGSQQMYGVEVHANILQSYMQGRFSINGNPFLLGIISALVAILLHLVFRKLKPWQSVIILVAAVTAYVFIMIALNNKGYSFHMIYLPLVLFLSYIYSLAMGYILEQSRKKKVLNAFKKYVAPQIVEEIAKKGDFQVKVGGENRDIAVLFVDIRGFTTMSEALEPEKVVEILNEYLALTTKAIFDNSGTLDKFVGDAAMAVFNSPFDLEDYEFKAVCAAMDIVRGGQELEKVLLEKYGRTVGFGVGVNVGPAVVGNIGCDFRMDFTAIGDTVNTAARLEANAKKGQVLISDVLYERVKDRVKVNDIGEIPLKGKSKGVFVYEVTEVDR